MGPSGQAGLGIGVLRPRIALSTGGDIQVNDSTSVGCGEGRHLQVLFCIGYHPIQESVVFTYRNYGQTTTERPISAL